MQCVRPALQPASPAPVQQGLSITLRPLLAGSLYRSSPAAATERRSWQLNLHSKESVEAINVANLRVNQRSQINDTFEPSLSAQDINPMTYYVPDLIFAPCAGFVPGSVQLIRPGRVLRLALARSHARPSRQPLGELTALPRLPVGFQCGASWHGREGWQGGKGKGAFLFLTI